MKALILNASPDKNGYTAKLISGFMQNTSYESEIYNIYDMEIAPCNDCKACNNKKGCIINDDMAKLYTKLENADIIVFATPVYFGSIPSPLKAVIDRLNALWHKNNGKFNIDNKRRGIVLCTMGGADPRDLDGVTRLIKIACNVIGVKYAGAFIAENIDTMTDDVFETVAEKIISDATEAIFSNNDTKNK